MDTTPRLPEDRRRRIRVTPERAAELDQARRDLDAALDRWSAGMMHNNALRRNLTEAEVQAALAGEAEATAEFDRFLAANPDARRIYQIRPNPYR